MDAQGALTKGFGVAPNGATLSDALASEATDVGAVVQPTAVGAST